MDRVEEANDACFIVKDHNGHALAYVYFENEPGRRVAANLLTRTKPGASRSISPSCRNCRSVEAAPDGQRASRSRPPTRSSGSTANLCLVLRLALPARIRLPSKRLPYHQIARTRRERGEHSKCRRNSSLHENRDRPTPTKCRNQRDNSQAAECRYCSNVRYLISGAERAGFEPLIWLTVSI